MDDLYNHHDRKLKFLREENKVHVSPYEGGVMEENRSVLFVNVHV